MIELFETDVLTMDGGALAFAKFGRGENDPAESYVLKFIAEHAAASRLKPRGRTDPV